MTYHQLKVEMERLRKDKNLTCRELALRAGLAQNTYWAWQNDDRIPNAGTLNALAVALGKRLHFTLT